MSYEPRGKVKALIEAMRAAAVDRPVWTSVEVAKVLEASTNAVPAFLAPSISHGVLFHKLENGRSRYSLKPFAPAATAARRRSLLPPPPWPGPARRAARRRRRLHRSRHQRQHSRQPNLRSM